MKENLLVEKSLDFATRMVKLRKHLLNCKQENVLSLQILKSGTSIGANIHEANYAQSKADFISKMHIALKETAETEYWLKLLYRSDYLTIAKFNSLSDECVRLKKLLTSTINTAKNTVSNRSI